MSDGTTRALEEHRDLLDRIRACSLPADEAARLIVATYERGGRVITFGNGGSAADAQHITGELVGRFKRERRPLAAIALSVDPSVVTCIANDYSFDDVFARQVQAHRTRGRRGDRLHDERPLGERRACLAGGARGGREDDPVRRRRRAARGRARRRGLVVPSPSTARVQEMHLFLMHVIVEQVDGWAAAERREGGDST